MMEGWAEREGKQAEYRSVLVLDDDAVLASALKSLLELEGWQVECAYTAGEARMKLSQRIFDLVLADYLLPDENGLAVLDDVQDRSPLTRVILMTGVQDMQVASRAFRKGVADLICKPFDLDELEERIDSVMRASRLDMERVMEKDPSERLERPDGIVGDSEAMREIFRLIQLVAHRNTSVLITGESGTGKELVARAIHQKSPRRDKPLVAVNCGAIPEPLLEDELFGHVAGAFTDARQPRTGKLEQANGGTFFLDEISAMPLSLQVKLLRALELKQIVRLGSNETIKLDIRFIAVSNCDLQEKVRSGGFRDDLYYRLNVVPIRMSSLRERKEDVPLLAAHFLAICCAEHKLPDKKLPPEVLKSLMDYDWPGNVRELRNVLEFASVLCGERTVLTLDDFPTICSTAAPQLSQAEFSKYMRLPEEGIDLNRVMDEFERNLILQSLQRSGGNKGEAARLLYLKRTTLVEKLRRMNLSGSQG